mmetsp:Transcript_52502/g.76721  ORF Transcript_52502/g.76721 Transcript_52502/m.76721 type:complete len:190 (-) Transcript_52502:140-709(-)
MSSRTIIYGIPIKKAQNSADKYCKKTPGDETSVGQGEVSLVMKGTFQVAGSPGNRNFTGNFAASPETGGSYSIKCKHWDGNGNYAMIGKVRPGAYLEFIQRYPDKNVTRLYTASNAETVRQKGSLKIIYRGQWEELGGSSSGTFAFELRNRLSGNQTLSEDQFEEHRSIYSEQRGGLGGLFSALLGFCV